MTLRLSAIDRVDRTYDASVLVTGGTGTVGALSFALLPFGKKPNADTVWKTYPVLSGSVTVTFVGKHAVDKTDALEAFGRGGRVFVREVNGAQQTATPVEWVAYR